MGIGVKPAIQEHVNGQILILQMAETIDQEGLQRIASTLPERGIQAVVINLSAVSFIESSGLGALVAAYKDFKDVGVPLGVTGVQPYVQKLIGLTKLDRILQIFPSESEALRAFSLGKSDR
jgi:anti-sigma B factor antagonist